MRSSLSLIASVAILRGYINDFVPQEIRSFLKELASRFSSELTMRVTVGKNENIKALPFSLDRNLNYAALQYELKWYELCFHKRHACMIRNKYLPCILEMAKKIKDQNRVVKFYTTRGGRDGWSCKGKGINLDHPMTFDTLAMDGNLKQKVIEDLDKFIKGKECYKRIGKVWKRGYLLYGPLGTGKSSLIAAMANHLNFDIYNLKLLLSVLILPWSFCYFNMSNHSILVVEDINYSIELQIREAGNHPSDHDRTPRRPWVGFLFCCYSFFIS
uniref:ATPase AAA-type core domain-containing protein n=1 Tax=Populus trichocarpa TaxID=3694 RepID=A0A2K2AFE1_POPTR